MQLKTTICNPFGGLEHDVMLVLTVVPVDTLIETTIQVW